MNEPPLITISDPNRPGEPVDVLGAGSERQLWRPSRRQVTVLLVVLLVVAATVVPVLLVKHRDARLAADRRSVAQVDLSVPQDSGSDGFGGTEVSLSLRNDGPAAVQLVRGRVDRGGYGEQAFGVTVQPGETTVVHVTPESSCPKTVPHSGPTGVLLDVVTSRGVRTTVRVSTADSVFADDYLQAVQEQCHLYDLSESLDTNLQQASLLGRSVHVAFDVTNSSGNPRTLRRVQAPEGFRFAPETTLPVTLPGYPDHAQPVVSGILTVTSCALAQTARPVPLAGGIGTVPGGPGTLDLSSTAGFDGGYLTATISGDGDTEETDLYFGDELSNALGRLITSVCHG